MTTMAMDAEEAVAFEVSLPHPIAARYSQFPIYPHPHPRSFTPLLLEVNGRIRFADRDTSAVHTCAWCLPSFVHYDASYL